MSLLALKKVTKKFGELAAVKDLSFKVEPGEIVGLIGENGSGKTTTIKMICGLYEPTSGQIEVDGLNVVTQGEDARYKIGYIPDEPAVYDKLTGDELLHFISQAYEVDKKKAQTRINELKKRFPMEDQLNGYFEDYSRGTRQKFMIMAALLHEPSLLLIDEPIVGLDPESAHSAVEIFRSYVAQNNRAILVSTHTLWAAERLCSKFIILSHGSMSAYGSLTNLREKTGLKTGSLEEIYLKLVKKERENPND